MKSMLLLAIMVIAPWYNGQGINPKAEKVLKAWVAAQNDGSDSAVINFIKKYYPESAYETDSKLNAHVRFCRQIIDEFGDVGETIYEVMENQPKKLKVQLLKAGVAAVTQPSPEEILVIEIDLESKDQTRLARGLGMGALICYIKR